MATIEMCRCSSCGYEWRRGMSGKHSCSINLQDKLNRLTDALKVLSIDMHQKSTRPCATCRTVTSLLGTDFGCDAHREIVRKRNETATK